MPPKQTPLEVLTKNTPVERLVQIGGGNANNQVGIGVDDTPKFNNVTSPLADSATYSRDAIFANAAEAQRQSNPLLSQYTTGNLVSRSDAPIYVTIDQNSGKFRVTVPNALKDSSAIKNFAAEYDKILSGKTIAEANNLIMENDPDNPGYLKIRQDVSDSFQAAVNSAFQNKDTRSILNSQWAAGNDSFTEDDARNYYRLYSLTLDKDGKPTKGNLSEILDRSVPYYDINTGKIGEKSFKDVTTDEVLNLMPGYEKDQSGNYIKGKKLAELSQDQRNDLYAAISKYAGIENQATEKGVKLANDDSRRLALLSGYLNIMDSNDYNRLTELEKFGMRVNSMGDAVFSNIVQGVSFLPNVLASAVYATAGGGQGQDEGWVENFGGNMGKITNDLNNIFSLGKASAKDYQTQLYRGYVNEDGSAQIGGASSIIGTMLALGAQIATPAALGGYAAATRGLASSTLGGVGTSSRTLPGVSTLLKQSTATNLLRDARVAETIGAVIDGGVTASLNTAGKVANMAMDMLDKAVGATTKVGVDAAVNPIARSAIYGAITDTIDKTPDVLRSIGLSEDGARAATGSSFADLISAPAQTGRTPLLGASDIGRVSQAWGGVQNGLRSFVGTISRLSPDLLTEYGERLGQNTLADTAHKVAKQKAAGEITGEVAESSIRQAQRNAKAQQLFYRTLNDTFKNMPVAAAMSYAGALGNVNAMIQSGMIDDKDKDKAIIDETIKSLLLSAAMFVLPGAAKTTMSSLDAMTNGGVGHMNDALGRNARRVVLAHDYLKRNMPIVKNIIAKYSDPKKAGTAGELRTEITRQYVKGKGKVITKEQFLKFRNMTSGAHGDYILAKIMKETGFNEVFKAGDALNKTLDVGVTRMSRNKGTQVQKLVGEVINKTEQMYRNDGSLKAATGKRARKLEDNISKLKTDISNARSQLDKMGDADAITMGINRVTEAMQNGYAKRADILNDAKISYGDQLEVLRSSPEFEHGYIRLMLDNQESDDEIIKHISSFFMHSGKNADPKKVLQTVKNETNNLDNAMNPFSVFMTSMQDTADLLVRNDTNKMVTDLIRNSQKTGSPIGKVLVDGDDMARAGQRVIQYEDFKKTFQAQVDEQIDVLVSSTGEAADPDAFVNDLYSYTLNDNYIKNLARKAGVSTELMARSSIMAERESILNGVYNRYVKEKGQKFAMTERAKVSKAIEETATNRAGIRRRAEARAAEKSARQTEVRNMTNEQISKISNDANASKMDKLIAHDEMVNRRIAPDNVPEIVQPRMGESLARFDKQLPEVQNLTYKYLDEDKLNKVSQLGPDYEVSVGSMNFVSKREMRGILSSDIPTAKQAAAARARGENPGMTREDLGIDDLPSYYFSKQGTLPDQFTTMSDTDPQGWVYMSPEEAMGQIRSATSALAENAAIRDEVSQALNNTDLIAMARDEYVYNIGNTPNMVLKNDVVSVAKNTGFSQDNAARAMNKLPAEAIDLLKSDKPVSPTVLASAMNYLGLSGKYEATISHFSDALNVPWSKADQNSPLADIAVLRTNVEKALYDAGDMTTLHAYRKKIVDETNALAKSFGESIDDRIIKRQIQSSSNDKTALDMIGFYKEKLLDLRTREYVQQTSDVFYYRRNLSAPEKIVAVRSGEYEIQDFNPLVNSRGYMHTYDAIADTSLGDATNNPLVAFGDGLMVDVRDKALIGRLANRIEKDFGGIPELSATRKDFVDKARGSIEDGAPFAYNSITKPAVIEAMKGYGIVGMRMSGGKTADDIILWDAKPITKGGDWFDKMEDVNTLTDQEISNIKTNNKLASEIYRSDYAKAEEELSANERRVYGAKQAGEVVITYVQDGKKYISQIDSPGLAAVYANTPARQMGKIGKGLAKFSNSLRLGTTGTLNVPYAAVNYIRDFMEAALATPGALWFTKYSKDLFISMTAMSDMTKLSDTELIKIFEELSTAYSTYNKNVTDAIYADAPKDRTRITMSEMAKHTENTGRRVRYRLGTFGGQKENLEFAMNKIEVGRRNAVAETTFMQAYQDQMAGVLAGNITKEQAVSNAMERAIAYARDATTDFSMRSGNLNALYASIPYLRAVVNGSKSFGNVFAMDPIGMTARIFAYAVAPMIAITASNTSDPYKAAYYENIPEYERQGNLIWMNDDGTYYEAPLPQPIQWILGGPRTWVERKNNVYANSGVVESMLQGAAMLSPVDFSGFFQRDIEGDMNQSLGWLRMINSVMPNAVTPVLEGLMDTNLFTGNPLNPSIEDLISMGVKPEMVDGKLQIDPSKYTYSKSNSRILGMLANMTGIPQGEIQNGVGRYMGTFGKYAINGIDRLIGAPTDEQGGQDVLTNTANRFFGADPQAAESAFSAGMSRFYDLKAQIINAVDYKTSEEDQNNLIKKYTQDLVTFTDAYDSYYRNSGGMTDLKRERLINLLNFSKNVSTTGAAYSESNEAQSLREMAAATKRAVDAGLVPSTGLRQYQQGKAKVDKDGNVITDENGNPVIQYVSPAMTAVQNRIYGAPTEAVNQFKISLDTALPSGVTLEQAYDNAWKNIDAVYDRADKAGRKLQQSDYDEIASYKEDFMQDFDSKLVPLLEKYSTSILSNPEFRGAIEQYAKLAIPDEVWKKGTNGRFLSTTKYPNITVDIKDVLRKRYANLLSVGKTAPDSGRITESMLQRMRGGL